MSEISFRIDRERNIAHVIIDTHGPLNVIGGAFLSEMQTAAATAVEAGARGIIFSSAKKRSFLDGADLKELFSLTDPDSVRALLKTMHGTMAALARAKLPVTAVLNGQTALGGGFELLLWGCDHVFATKGSRLGLPEVNLGLIPAGGGTQTLRKALGLAATLDIIMGGRVLPAESYADSGFLTVCEPDELMERAVQWIEENGDAVNRNYDPGYKDPGTLPSGEEEALVKKFRSRYTVSSHRRFYEAALEAIIEGKDEPFEKALDREITLFCELFQNPVTKNKLDLFILNTGIAPRLMKAARGKAAPADSLAIIGAGLMGRGIAQVSADKGMKVLLIDVNDQVLNDSAEVIGSTLDKLVARGRWMPERRDKLLANIEYTTDYRRLEDIPLVIESVPENLDLKRRILRKVQEVNPDTIFASNTSSMPMADISEGAIKPEMVVGMHYFSPVPLMALLEIIRGPQTRPDLVPTAVATGMVQGKTCIVVNDGPGFYTSRTFALLVIGGVFCAEFGADPWEIDLWAREAGFPQGPLDVFGSVGGEIVYHAGRFLESRFPGRIEVPESIERLVEAGYTGAGKPCFYTAKKKPDPSAAEFIVRKAGVPAPTREEVQDILLYGMANEAFQIKHEGVLTDYMSMELGAVLGIGFPDIWHGPARFVSSRGVTRVRDRLQELHDKFGIKYLEPSRLFDYLAASGVESSLV